jgi:outer membrane lipoprotein-sorting protein
VWYAHKYRADGDSTRAVCPICASTFAQAQPDIAEILKKVSETYKSASQYELIADTTVQGARARAGTVGHMLFAFKAPNQYRMEGTSPSAADFSEVVTVHDGSALWFYMPKSNQYGSFPAGELTAGASSDLGDAKPEAMDHFMMWRYRGAVDSVSESKFLRQEPIDVGGVRVDCFVVTVSFQESRGPYTWWVDKKGYHILREDHDNSSAVFTTIKLGEILPEDLFKFVPPAGAQKIEPPH